MQYKYKEKKMLKEFNTNFVFDAECTLFSVEGLEKLAKIALNGDSNAAKIIDRIQQVCYRGMNGEIPFNESLQERMELFNARADDVNELAEIFKKSLAPSIFEYKFFFKENKENIYVISGGFKDFLMPALIDLGIKKENIFANSFIYDKEGLVIGFDKTNPLSKAGGKIEIVRNLNFDGEVIIIGDGTSELEVKEAGFAHEFWVYTEICRNIAAIDMADREIDNFGQIVKLFKNRVIV